MKDVDATVEARELKKAYYDANDGSCGGRLKLYHTCNERRSGDPCWGLVWA